MCNLCLTANEKEGKSFELSFIHENVWQRKEKVWGRWKINAEQALSLFYTFEPWTKPINTQDQTTMYKYQIPEPTFDSNGFATGHV